MQFVYPYFLYALLLIAIPIIIHLFNFKRYKKLVFPNTRFLRAIKEQTQAESKLKELLILLSRILAFVFLVLAFAQPYIPNTQSEKKNSAKGVFFYLDNSYSMSNTNSEGTLLQQSKKMALERIKMYPNTSRFMVLTNQREERSKVWLDKAQAQETIDQVTFTNEPSDIQRTYSMIKHAQNDTELMEVYWISDFQKSTYSSQATLFMDTTLLFYPIQFIPLETKNINVDSCWFIDPYRMTNRLDQIHFRISNKSSQNSSTVQVRLVLNEQEKNRMEITINPNSTIDTLLAFTVYEPGVYTGEIILDDQPISFDNTFYFSFEIKAKTNVLSVYEQKKSLALEKLFKEEPSINYTSQNVTQLDYSLLETQDFLILEDLVQFSSGLTERLKSFLLSGGNILVCTPRDLNVSSYNAFFTSLQIDALSSYDTSLHTITQINTLSPLLKNVFTNTEKRSAYGKVNGLYTSNFNQKSMREFCVKTQSNLDVLTIFSSDKGKVYVLYSGLDQSAHAFTNNSLFVPTLLNMAYQSVISKPLYYILQSEQKIPLINTKFNDRRKRNPYHLVQAVSTFDVIPDIRFQSGQMNLILHDEIQSPGHYFIQEEQKNIAFISFNYSSSESDLRCIPSNELKDKMPSDAQFFEVTGKNNQQILQNIEKQNYWQYAIILSLLFLIIETFLVRFLKF